MDKKILVVEDDKDIQEIISEFLKANQYIVELADDGFQGIEKFNNGRYDLIILDIMLPRVNGFVVCETIRKTSDIPVIMLTALEEEQDQLRGFELKIDDYITKPFSVNILVKKVEAILRRSGSTLRNPAESTKSNDGVIKFEEITIDKDSYMAWVGSDKADLTVKEFEILEILMKNRGKVITRETLLDKLWGYDFYGDTRVIDTHIKNLRHKLGAEYIKTIRGVGYKLEK